MSFALTMESGVIQAFPDVCKIPAPPGPDIPTPFPNMGMPAMANPVTAKVLIGGAPALTVKSQIKPSQGDQAGVNGGLVSGKIMGEDKFTMGSVLTKFEGNPPVFVGCPTTHNAGNTVGAASDPGGQVKVSIGS